MSFFADWQQKSVTIAMSLEGSCKKVGLKVGLIRPTPMCTYLENTVKIGPEHSEIIGLQGDR